MNEFLRSASIIDLIAFAVLCVSSVSAFSRRLSGEIASLVNWLGALFAAIWVSPYLAPLHERFFGESRFAAFAAALVLFVIVFLGLLAVTPMLSVHLKRIIGSSSDRMLGLLYGLVRGFAVLCLLGFLLNFSMSDIGEQRRLPKQITDSFSWPIVNRAVQTIMKNTLLKKISPS